MAGPDDERLQQLKAQREAEYHTQVHAAAVNWVSEVSQELRRFGDPEVNKEIHNLLDAFERKMPTDVLRIALEESEREMDLPIQFRLVANTARNVVVEGQLQEIDAQEPTIRPVLRISAEEFARRGDPFTQQAELDEDFRNKIKLAVLVAAEYCRTIDLINSNDPKDRVELLARGYFTRPLRETYRKFAGILGMDTSDETIKVLMPPAEYTTDVGLDDVLRVVRASSAQTDLDERQKAVLEKFADLRDREKAGDILTQFIWERAYSALPIRAELGDNVSIEEKARVLIYWMGRNQ